jgi:L,D-peptidoglycan transpeptidase YkuD (ErfK/YbiS/YcfS/YnhG family)
MDLTVARVSDGAWRAVFGAHDWRCAIGPAGVTAEKREGDGATPCGCFPLRRVLYRPDRLARPETLLPVTPLAPDHGWCDDPHDGAYNTQVRLPFGASHERLWRDDGIYDAIVILGHNDDPPLPGAGSAIFLHVARDDYAPTQGCVALALPDLLTVLREAEPETRVCVESP